MHAHARNCFRRAENVNKLVANHANATNMYKVNDLKCLKKAELLEVAAVSKLQLVSAKSTKRQLIETLVNHGVCQRSPAAVDSVGSVASDSLPVDFKLDCLFYRTVTDHTLHIIPNCSFHQLYTYFRGTEETSVKSLDRAAKHASAGDITCVKMCQVCILYLLTPVLNFMIIIYIAFLWLLNQLCHMLRFDCFYTITFITNLHF